MEEEDSRKSREELLKPTEPPKRAALDVRWREFIKRILPARVLFLVQNRHVFYALCRAYLIIIIKASPYTPFNKAPRIGYLRGIDFYKGSKLISTIASAMYGYRWYHGVYPNLLKPKYFDEKLIKLKFFTELKVPE